VITAELVPVGDRGAADALVLLVYVQFVVPCRLGCGVGVLDG
jgi:hypothetical protein